MNDHELMKLHADILFRYDSHGRMLTSNAPEGRPAPRVFIGYTSTNAVVRFGQGMPEVLADEVIRIVRTITPCADLRAQPRGFAVIRAALDQHAPVTREGAGPAYRFPESIEPPGDIVQVTEDNLDLTRDTYPWLLTELRDWWPCFAVVRDGAAVAVCFSSRIGARAAEAGVDTLPAFRGCGYATAVAAAWGAAIRASGRVPLYSTSWKNLASQGVARRLGLIIFGADATWD